MKTSTILAGALLLTALTTSPAEAANAYYVAPNGNDSAAGTQAAPWASIARAQSAAQPGDTVYLRGGTYAYTRANSSCSSQTARVDAITLNKSGSAGSPIRYWAYPGERPVFDFSRMTDNCRIKGFDVTGSRIHLKGLEIKGVPQNNDLNAESWGVWISGSGNTFEQLDIHHIMGTGLFINGGGGNLVVNSDSHDNYDLRSSDGPGENADGFGSHYSPAGSAGNVFRGCRAWWNADDGFDLISTYSSVLIERSWAWRNGYVPGTTTAAGNGNGFKAGGYGGDYDANAVKHTVRLSVAFANRAAGFYANHHPVANDYFNNTSYGNHPDYNMLGVDSSGGAVGRGNLRNNIAYTGTLTSNLTGTSSAYNTWDLGIALSDAQFQSVSTSGWDARRQADGSLPVLPNLRLAANSTLIDKGTDVGLPYHGSAPDLGAFEQSGSTTSGGLESREAADEGTFQTITNDSFRYDTSGNPIYSQGGGIFKFGDTYYWYGVHYVGAELYQANPTRQYDNDVTFVSIPVYSSKDLVNWTFENNVATRSTAPFTNGGWVGRLGVSYNENTRKYVLVVQGPGGIVFLQGDSPTGTFVHAATQAQIVNSPTPGTGDQTVFTDDDGKDYLIFSNSSGRARAFVSKLRESDSLYAEPAVQIGYCSGCGREGNAMFKLDGRYYHASSDLHGWNSSVSHVIESTGGNIQGTYTSEYTLAGTELDYSHVTQTGFFVTVKGTKQTTVIFAGDRWADFAWNGIGYNQWMPVTKTGARPQFHSVSQWQLNATTGEWRVGPANNYVLNPGFQADRIITSPVTGWTSFAESGPNAVTNVSGGANGSRFALQIGATQSYAGGVRQQITVPAGTYRMSLFARTTGSLSAAQLTVTDGSGGSRTLTIPASSGWTRRELADIPLPAGPATVTIRAASSNGFLFADDLSLVKTSTDAPPPPVAGRYEVEAAPAVCQGAIASNHTGFSGTGFCDGTAAVGAYAQFTVSSATAGQGTLGVRFANGASGGLARPANLIVNGSMVGSVSFESTGAWTTWATKTLTAQLTAGPNTIRLDPTTTAGLPNVDYLEVSAAGAG
ncbi:right-handed parallel beta-helix repeat-containing protein [Flindersiella endophytica]